MLELCKLPISMFNLSLEEEEGEKLNCVAVGANLFLKK